MNFGKCVCSFCALTILFAHRAPLGQHEKMTFGFCNTGTRGFVEPFRRWKYALFVCTVLWTAGFQIAAKDEAADAPQPWFSYDMTKGRDIPLSIASAGIFAGGMIAAYSVDPVSAPEIALLDTSDVNAFDRPATRRWSPASGIASNVTVTVAGVIPLALSVARFSKKQTREGLILTVMYAQAMGMTVGLTGMFKAIVQRERPFLYNDSLSTEKKMELSGTRKSFYSQHTAIAFCSGVFLSKAFSDMYPESKWRFFIWPASLLLAGTTGLLRFTAGKHFPSDVLVGAAAGALIGLFVPILHQSKRETRVSLYPMLGEQRGMGALILF